MNAVSQGGADAAAARSARRAQEESGWHHVTPMKSGRNGDYAWPLLQMRAIDKPIGSFRVKERWVGSLRQWDKPADTRVWLNSNRKVVPLFRFPKFFRSGIEVTL